ncbi:MAG: RNA polymerase sigma factor FliA [Gammaproteobacteria bacterium]|nr:RNA polymerase sigma factor FliA [Gammaproteobacteria bacterium]
MRDSSVATYQDNSGAGSGAASKAEVLVHRHASLVKRIAHHLLARLPNHVELSDLVQSGMIGLLEAAQKYDATKGASFETYAGIRIRGSMLDEVRRGDWAPRSVHRNARRIAAAIRSVELRTFTAATDAEIAEALEVPVDEYHAMLRDTAGCRLFSFDEMSVDEETGDIIEPQYAEVSPGPAESVQGADFRRRVIEAMTELPEREQLVLSLYYDEELNLKEIGAILGVSESRISQIHTQATLRIRTRLEAEGGA